MGLVVIILIGAGVLFSITLGYAAYWLCGGDVTPEIWRSLAVTWASLSPLFGFSVFAVWMDQ